jgi:rhamnose transport system permease protein
MLARALSQPELRPSRLPALTHERVLAGLLAVEVVAFSLLGRNFLSGENGFEILRLSVEIGLLALALTPVIVSGGIDLSVGSLMGLSAVVFGKLWRDGGFPLPAAAAATLVLAAAAGGLNALLIARFRLPPLIVTLGTLSLFRGLAEALARGVDNFTGFPPAFLAFGQGGQIPVFLAAAAAFWLFLHRTTAGRGLVAIGWSPEGAAYAGVPVARRLALVYVLSGAVAGLAAVVYVAHHGQAKADAGTFYELKAVTAVVLGGTSIFGGRGAISGTLLGLFAIAVLENGLRMADAVTSGAAELAGILTGVLLVGSILVDRALARRLDRRSREVSP